MRAAIFDFDGVIANSEPLHFAGPARHPAEEGVGHRRGRVLPPLPGLRRPGGPAPGPGAARPGQRPRPHRDAWPGASREVFEALLPTVPFFPGAARPRARAGRRGPGGHRLGRAPRGDRGHPGGGRTARRVPRDRGRRRRPAGQAPSRAVPDRDARRLGRAAPGLRPEDCVVFEDSMPGIAAARAAGMKVVAVTNSYPAAKLGAAHRVVDTLAGIDARACARCSRPEPEHALPLPRPPGRQAPGRVPLRLRPQAAGRQGGAGPRRRGRPGRGDHRPAAPGRGLAGGRLQARPGTRPGLPAEAAGRLRGPGADRGRRRGRARGPAALPRRGPAA